MNMRICADFVVLTTVVMVTTGLICQNPECEYVKCDPVNKDNCTGTIRLGGGLCGCCSACFTHVGIDEPCESRDTLHAMFYPPTVLCDMGLYCENSNLTCQPIQDHYLG